jgi:hypothetical protein
MDEYIKRSKKSDKEKKNRDLYGKYNSKYIRAYTEKNELKLKTKQNCK